MSDEIKGEFQMNTKKNTAIINVHYDINISANDNHRAVRCCNCDDLIPPEHTCFTKTSRDYNSISHYCLNCSENIFYILENMKRELRRGLRKIPKIYRVVKNNKNKQEEELNKSCKKCKERIRKLTNGKCNKKFDFRRCLERKRLTKESVWRIK